MHLHDRTSTSQYVIAHISTAIEMKCGCIMLKRLSHLVFVPFTVKSRDSCWHGCEFPTNLCLCN